MYMVLHHTSMPSFLIMSSTDMPFSLAAAMILFAEILGESKFFSVPLALRFFLCGS